MSPYRRARRAALAIVALLTVLALPSILAAVRYAGDPLRYAVGQVRSRGSYEYDARIETTLAPEPGLENVGLSSQRKDMAVRGAVDLRHETLDLTILQSDGGYASGRGALEMHIADGVARGRVGDGAWQPVALPGGVFSPGGDFLGLLDAARDVRRGEPLRRGGEELARYSFAIDAPAFAQRMREQMQRSLSDQNRLPVGMSLGQIDAYLDATGSGELLVSAAGLPVRQVIRLTIPDRLHGQIVEGTVTIDFSGFPAAPPLSLPPGWAYAVAWDQLLLSLAAIAAAAAAAAALARMRRAGPVYGVLTAIVLVATLTSPLLQAGQLKRAYAAESAAPAQPEAAPAPPSRAAAGAELRAAALSAAAELGAGSDGDGDGLTDAVEARIGTNPAAADSDDDGLSDGVEVLELGTRPTAFDTDGDSLGDGLELEPIVGGDGRTRYLDPFQADTNRDGQSDFAECVGASYCPDTDGDGTPDAWDDDNDGDGVPDWLDSAPASAVSGGANPDGTLKGVPGGAFTLNVAGNQPGLPMLVDFTLRPTNPGRLWYSGNVLDWPADDRAGQVQRVFDTTFGSSGNLADGDMRLSPMLEITIPYVAGSFGGLPVRSDYAGADLPSLDGVDLADTTATAAWFGQWLDQEKLSSYQASVRVSAVQDGHPTLLVYLPLDVLRDSQGGSPVAFTARMLYRPKADISGQSVRLAWSVQVQTDHCAAVPASDDAAGESYNRQRWDNLPADQKQDLKYTSWEKLSAAERSQIWCADNANWQSDAAPSVVQTYYDDFYLSALDVSEERGIDVGVVLEEKQPDTQPLLQHRLWGLAQNLDRVFVAGRDCDSLSGGACQADGARDLTVAEIKHRFDRLANGDVGAAARWGVDQALRVATYSFSDPGDLGRLSYGYRQNGQDQEPLLNAWLNEVYAPARGPAASLATPTALVARERTFRGGGLALATIGAGTLSIDLSDVLPMTQAGLSWQPFSYKGAGVWEAYDVGEYYDALDSVLTQSLQGAGGAAGASPATVAGSVRLLKSYYLSLVNGRTQGVALAGIPISVAPAAVADVNLGLPAGAAATLAALAQTMAGLVVDSQAHRALLAPADAGGLLDAIGRQSLYQDGGPALSLLQGLGNLKGAEAAGYMLSSALAGVAETIAQADPDPEPISTVINSATEKVMMAHDIVTGMLDVYEQVRAIGGVWKSVKALSDLKGVYQGIKSAYAAQQAVGTSGKLLGTINDALKEGGRFALVLTIVVEVIAFAAKLVALIQAGNASAVSVIGLIVETVISLALGLIMMSVIAAVVPIGTLIAAIVGLIDLLITGICALTGLDESDNWLVGTFCQGIMGNLSRLLMAVFYDTTPLVDMDAEGRLNPTNWQVTPHDPQSGATTGFVDGSVVGLQADVVTTLDVDNYAVIRSGGTLDADDLSRSTFRYEFTAAEEQDDQRINARAGVALDQMTDKWRPVDIPYGFDQRVYTSTITTSLTLDRAGLNWRPDGLFLAEGYATPGVLCVTAICGSYEAAASNYINLADNFVFDVFPSSIDGFYSLADDDGDGGFRLAWDDRFPDLADADGDNLRSRAAGGADPNDNSPDSDGDGLSDFYELQHADQGLDPRRADSDGDGLSDYQEIRLGLNPAVADIDNDGLSDGEEIAGWEIVYGYDAADAPLRFRTSSDPFDPDTDDDGILDKREQIYGFNPRVFNSADVLQIQSRLVEGDGRADGIVAAGSSIGFSATITNTLRDRFALGLFETDLESTALKPDLAPAAYRLAPLAQSLQGGTLSLAGQSTTAKTTLLTRAGAIIADLEAISGGRVLWLPFEESSSGAGFADASPFGNDATCAGAGCPSVTAAGYSGRAISLSAGQTISVADSASLRPERFTLSLWLNPRPAAAAQGIVQKASGPGAQVAYQLGIPAGSRRVSVLAQGQDCATTAVSAQSTRDLTLSAWSLLTLVYDGGQLRLYINGQDAGAWAVAGGLCASAGPLSVGALQGAGQVDDLSLYPFPMTAAEVQSQFKDPVLRLDFNGAVEDRSNLRQSIAVNGAGALTMANSRGGDRVGVFDKKRWVDVAGSPSLDMAQGTGQFSLSAFIRPVPLGPDAGWQGVLGKEDGNNSYPSLYVNSAGQLNVRFGTGSALCDSGATPALLSGGAWSHVTVTYDGAQFIFYIDGAERARLPLGSCAAGARPVGSALYVGRVSPSASLTLKSIQVDDEGDGAGDAEYYMQYDDGIAPAGDATIWQRDSISIGTYNLPDGRFTGGYSNVLAIPSDSPIHFTLVEDDDFYDDTEIDQQVRPYQVADSGSWTYDDDGQGTLYWRVWNSWFNGDLDEVQIYRVALGADDVGALYSGLSNRAYALRARLEEPPTSALFRDGSGNLLTGYCAGDTCPTSGLPGRDGQAAYFDGGDSIVVTDRPAIDLASGFTVGAWVKLDSAAPNQKIVSKFDLALGGYILGVENGQIYGEVRDTRGNTSTVRGGSVQSGVWTHLAISASAGQYLIGYVDGVEVARAALAQTTRSDAAYAYPTGGSATLYGDPNYEHDDDNMLVPFSSSRDTFDPPGAGNDDLDEASSAKIDGLCIRIYADESYGGASRPVCDDTPLLAGFEDDTESAWVYTSPPSYDAAEQALRLNSGEMQHLRIPAAGIGSPVFSTISVAAWVKPNNPARSEWQTIVARGSSGLPEGFSLRLDGVGRLHFAAGNGEWSSSAAIGAGWSHVAVTLDGTRVRFYINGAERGSYAFGGNINDVLGDILVGRMPQCGAGDYCDFYDGYIRDLAIFTRAIGADEVAGLMGAASGAGAGNPEASGADPNGRVLFLPLDEPGGGAGARTFRSLVAEPIGANDAPLTVGRASWGGFFARGLIDEVAVLEYAAAPAEVAALMDGAPVLRMAADETLGAASFADVAAATPGVCAGDACPQAGARGRIREAFVFGAVADGADDVVSVPDAARLDLARFSAELWLRPEAVRQGEQVILAKANDDGSGANYILSLAPGSLRLRLSTSAGSVTSQRALNQGQWNHIVASYDGAALRLFINGTPDPAAAAGVPATNGAPLRLGSLPAYGVAFKGMLDEPTIYGYALSADEIAAHYQYQESWFDVVDRHDLTVDGDSPSVALSVADNTVISAGDLQLSVAAADPTSSVAAVYYDADGDALADDWQPAARDTGGDGWYFTFSPPAPGSYPLRAYAEDIFGHQSAVATATVRVDGAAPALSLDAGLGAATLRPAAGAGADGKVWSLPIGGVASDALSAPVTVVATIAGPAGPVGAPLVIEGVDGAWGGDYRFPYPPNGRYTLSVRASDAVGNSVAAPAVELTLDATGPLADVTLGGTAIGSPGGALAAGGGHLGLRSLQGSSATVALPPVLGGTIIDMPGLPSGALAAHFEEPAGASSFLDGAAFQGRGVCSAPACPAAGGGGQRGAGLDFDGVDDTVVFADLPALGAQNGAFAASLWLRPAGVGEQVALSAGSGAAATLELRLDAGSLRVFATVDGAQAEVGAASLSQGAWSHVALSFDGRTFRTFVGGALASEVAVGGQIAALDRLWLGSRAGGGAFFRGGADELYLYASAISADQAAQLSAPVVSDVAGAALNLVHLKDHDNPAAALAPTVAITNGAGIALWSAAVPADIEGPYLVSMQTSDSLGNSRELPNIWAGDIDTLAPRASMFYRDLGDGRAQVSCVVSDYNLDPALIQCPVPFALWQFEDLAEPWYTAFFSSPRQVTMRTPVVTLAGASSSLQACDSFGNCTSVSGATSGGDVAGLVSIDAPADGQVITSLDPITVRGYARAAGGLDSLSVAVGASPLLSRSYSGEEEDAWSADFTPPGEGIYQIQASAQAAGGGTFVAEAAPTIIVDATAPALSLAGAYLGQADLPAPDRLRLSGVVTEAVGLTGLRARVDSGPWQDLALPAGLPGAAALSLELDAGAALADAQALTVTVEATDLAGRTTAVSRTLTVDLVGPGLWVADELVDETRVDGASLTVAGALSDSVGLARLEARVDGGAWEDLPLPASPAAGAALTATLDVGRAIVDGDSFVVGLRATDMVGQITTVARAVRVDLRAPGLAIPAAGEDGAPAVAGGSIGFTLAVTESVGLSRLEARLGGGDWQPLDAGSFATPGGQARVALDLAPLGALDGVTVDLEVRAVDRVGHSTSTRRGIFLDTAAPRVVVEDIYRDMTSQRFLARGTVRDGGGGLTLWLVVRMPDGELRRYPAELEPGATPGLWVWQAQSAPLPAQGEYTVWVETSDAAGNLATQDLAGVRSVYQLMLPQIWR